MHVPFLLIRQHIIFTIVQDQYSYYLMLNTTCSHSFASKLSHIEADASPLGREIKLQRAPFSLKAWSEQLGITLEGMIGLHDILVCKSMGFDWDKRLCYIDEIPPFLQEIDLDAHRSHIEMPSLQCYELTTQQVALPLQVGEVVCGMALLDSSHYAVHIPSQLLTTNPTQTNQQAVAWQVRTHFHMPSFQGALDLVRYEDQSMKVGDVSMKQAYPVISNMPAEIPTLIGMTYWVRHHIFFDWKQRKVWTLPYTTSNPYNEIEYLAGDLPFQITMVQDEFYLQLLQQQLAQEGNHTVQTHLPAFCLHIHPQQAQTSSIPSHVYYLSVPANDVLDDQLNKVPNEEQVNQLILMLHQQWQHHQKIQLYHLQGHCVLYMNDQSALCFEYL